MNQQSNINWFGDLLMTIFLYISLCWIWKWTWEELRSSCSLMVDPSRIILISDTKVIGTEFFSQFFVKNPWNCSLSPNMSSLAAWAKQRALVSPLWSGIASPISLSKININSPCVPPSQEHGLVTSPLAWLNELCPSLLNLVESACLCTGWLYQLVWK